jgi:hypothetical protein
MASHSSSEAPSGVAMTCAGALGSMFTGEA